MSVRFKMVPKQNNIASPPQTKYYPCAVSSGEVDLERLADTVADRSTLTPADCYAVMVAMSEVIGEELARGKIVKIDRLGTFSLTLKGVGTDQPELLNKNTILGAKILYKPAQHLKKILANLTYKRIR
jgi:predicted histone-like DNA-binding protein